jgi:ribosomal protein S18 acetylase RimI-like enzyme
MRWSVRRATVADARGLARINIAGWRGAYRGIVPEPVLESLDLERRTAAFVRRLAGERMATFVAVTPDDVVAAYATVTPVRTGSDDVPDRRTGELASLYADQDHLGQSAGHAAHQAGMDRLGAQGFDRAVLWVFQANTVARRFYERHGWCCDDVRRNEVLGSLPVREVRYSRSLSSA